MKKFFLLAAAALVALTACTKIDVQFNETDSANRISFTVADYSQQTKAGDETSLATGEDAIYSFHTYATQFPEIGESVLFMNDVQIKAWDNASTPAVVTSGTDIYTWAPDADYFWPKTGYINFYSYAGTKSPLTSSVVSSDKKTITFDYGTVTVAPTDNILVADAALRFNSNTETYKKDHVTKGVPTLFRHQLAKVKFKVHLKTTQPASTTTTWKVRTIASETIDNVNYASTLTIVKNGALKLQNADALADDAAKNTTTQTWTAVVGSSANVDGWIAGTTDSDKEVITLTTQTLTIPTTKQESQEADPVYLIEERTVMPQLTSGTKFVLYYEVSASHDDFATTFLKEIRSVGVDVAKTMADLVSAIPDWNKNTKITYTINIDPVSEKVTFDPAVEAWAEESGSFDVPLN